MVWRDGCTNLDLFSTLSSLPGTTAAGLRYGCPSWICPFFGDQHFWGEMVHRRKVGPKPCPIGALTLPIVADSLVSSCSLLRRLCAAVELD